MEIKAIESGKIYEKILGAAKEKRADLYRYELMKPFETKWKCIQVPLKAKVKGGYDVVMASRMLGILAPEQIDEGCKAWIQQLKDEKLWQACTASIKKALERFEASGIQIQVQDYQYTLLLANSESPYVKLSNGYFGDGGIPGYILMILTPNDYTLRRLPAAIAHECNHNVRYQYIKWNNQVTLAEMMVTEGLAEHFAVSLYGKEYLGPWVSKTSQRELETIIKPIIKKGLDKQGLDQITAYLYGDELAALQGYFPVGLPYCAGQACGYAMIQYYLDQTGDSIEKATIRPAQEILKEVEGFWDE